MADSLRYPGECRCAACKMVFDPDLEEVKRASTSWCAAPPRLARVPVLLHLGQPEPKTIEGQDVKAAALVPSGTIPAGFGGTTSAGG